MRGGCCLLAAAAALTGTAAAAAGTGTTVTVGYTAPANLHGLRVGTRIPSLRAAEVRVGTRAAEQALRLRPGIRYVEHTLPRADTGGPTVPEWQWTATHADAVPAWVTAAAASVTVAVVDTGADLSVPSLAAKEPLTWSVAAGTSDVTDMIGHGTFVASLVAGAGSADGGLVGFGGDARLMVVQANRGGTTFTDLDEAAGITWAVQHGAKIVNLSLGGSRTSNIERAAIDYATSSGVLLVAAAGNSAEEGNPAVYPAALIGRRGLVVGAADGGGARASFSTTGRYVDVLAPGVDVLGALGSGMAPLLFTAIDTPGVSGAYGIGSGTSYAAPEVAGTAALVWGANPLLDAAGVAATIEATATGGGVWTPDLAWGGLDVASAVARAASGAPAPYLAQPAAPAKPKRRTPKRAIPRPG